MNIFSNSLWLPDPKTNTIKRITPEGKVIIIAGKSLKSGFRNGDLKNTLFNNCFNLAYYNPSFFLQVKENNSVTIILKNNSSPCLYVNKTNYTICQDNNTNNSIINDTDLIKKIYLKTDEEITNLTIEYINNISNLTDLITSRVLFVVDKNNHCIRLIDIEKRISKTYAGICTIAGFQDGRLGTNLFKYPESLGVDIFGNVFVYDSGNQYIRMIKKNGCVLTLVPGACRRDFRYVSQNLPKFGLKNEVVTCYREWMNSTAGDNVCSESQSNFCYDEIFLCPNDQSPFIYNNSNT